MKPYRWYRDPIPWLALACIGWLSWLDPLAGVCVLVGVAGFEALLRRFTRKG